MKKALGILVLLAVVVGVALAILGRDEEPEAEAPVEAVVAEVEEEAPAPARGQAGITGRVIDGAGRPVQNARVIVGEREGQSDRAGRFTVGGLSAGEHALEVEAANLVRPGVGSLGQKIVELGATEVREVELRIQQQARIQGRVEADRRPVLDATLSLSYAFADGMDGRPLEPFIVSDVLHTDAAGHFDLQGLAPGRLQILVEAADYPFWESHEIYLRPGQTMEDLVLDIAPAGVVYGRVRSSEGPVRLASVEVRSLADGLQWNTRTDESGAFRVEGLGAGAYSVRVRASGFGDELVDDVFVEEDGEAEVNVELSSSQAFFGRVVDSRGDPVPAAQVIFMSEAGRHVIQANEFGRFQWDEPGEGSWTVRAASPRYDSSEQIPARAGQELTLELGDGGTIFGRVVDQRGQPVGGINVSVANVELAVPGAHHPRQLARGRSSDQDGEFRVGPLPPGRYRLVTQGGGYAPVQSDAVRVESGRDVTGVVLTLDSGSTLRGEVIDVNTGDPVERAVVQLMVPQLTVNTATASDGSFALDNVPGGRVSLQVRHHGYVQEYFTVEMPVRGEVTLELEARGPGNDGFAFHGIGAVLAPGDGGYRVVSLTSESAAGFGGVEVGDTILAVDGRPVDALMLDQVVELLRGNAGEEVSLRVRRPGQGQVTLNFERERVFVPNTNPRE